MGLFSSKKEYKVNVTVQKVFEDSQLPNSVLSGVVRGIHNDDDILDNVLEDLTASIGVRATSGYTWLKKQNYAIGLPSSGVKTYVSAESAVMSAITANIGKSITPEYYFMGPLNSMHFGWQHCHSALGYNPETNELTALSAQTGFKCYLADMVATYLQADYDWMVETDDMGMLDQMGPAPTSGWLPSAPYNTVGGIGQYAKQPPYVVSSVATEDFITITYEFKNAQDQFIRRGITVSMAAFDNVADFHQCRYVDIDGKTGFFTYQASTGTYPAIDAAMTMGHSPLGTYLPWTYMRRSNANVYDVESEETIDQMIQWCDYLGVSFNDLLTGVHDDGDVDDVAQVILLFGVSPKGKHPSELEYLFKHFSILHENAQPHAKLVTGLYEKMQAFTTSPSQAQRIQDRRFAMNFQFSGIQKQRKPGKIGQKGSYTSEYARVSQNTQTFATQGGTGTGTGTTVSSQPAWIYRYQFSDTMYEEVAVYGLKMNYRVHNKQGYAAGATSDELLIPADMTILRTMGLPSQEQVLCRSLRLMVNTVIVEKTPWYASGPFKYILLIVAVVITIFTSGAAWQSIVAAAALGVGALALTIITLIVQGLVVSYGVKLFVKAVGPELGFIAAIAAIAVGGYFATTAETSPAWAEGLVAIGNNMVKESNAAYGVMYQDAMQDLIDFQSWAQSEMDELQAKEDAFNLNPSSIGMSIFDPVRLIPGLSIGESPGDYFSRTVHSGNIGTASYGMVEYYASSMLQLPQLNDVMGNFENGVPGTSV